MASYFETRYLAPTNTKGSRVSVIRAGSRERVSIAPWSYEHGGGIDQHVNALNVALMRAGIIEKPLDMFEVAPAFATERGYVLRVEREWY
jgi:hypothetical protein